MRKAFSLVLVILAACGDIGLSGTGSVDPSPAPETASDEEAPRSTTAAATREAPSRGLSVNDAGASDSGPDADGGKGGKKGPKPGVVSSLDAEE